jgi:hypothetical protein
MDRPIVLDTEVYRNYFLAAFKCVETGKIATFERGLGRTFDRDRLARIMESRLTVGFNSIPFDLPIIWAALNGASCAKLKDICDAIIVGGLRPWQVEREFDLPRMPCWDHIDLIEVAPGQASLKIYGGRIHAPRMQDLPIEPEATITESDVAVLKPYCINDLDTTSLLMGHLRPQIELRESMSAEYGQDLRSRSDAQIAEAVIRSQLEARRGEKIERPTIPSGTICRYRAPDYITFTDPKITELVAAIQASQFVVARTGSIIEPSVLAAANVTIGGSVYRMGIGGLHSSEECTAHVADEDTILCDRDVASYYPAIILTQGLAPKHLGDPFLDVYRGIVRRRLEAKRAGDKVTADALKITVNGSFGKLGSMWSTLYSPDLMIAVTITGQLALLMLIERLERAGIPVVSGNTDGIVIKCPRDREADMLAIVAEWERETGFETEETRYSAFYARDVNNYIAVKEAGGVKSIGAYAQPTLKKSPANMIAITAAIAQITEGTPIEDTIRRCRDVRQFVTVRSVKGGAEKDGAYLGKAIRWYYARGCEGTITYRMNGNKVPRTDGARPLMQLPDQLPADVDFAWYEREARQILRDIGFDGYRPPKLPRRLTTYQRALIVAVL